MNGIHRKYFSDNERVSEASTSTYPCVLLGNMGIDKQFRNKGLGRKIVTFTTGLSRLINHKIACRYVVLHTNQDKVKLYERLGFIKSYKSKGKSILMFKKTKTQSD